jgi:hypothetical protein
MGDRANGYRSSGVSKLVNKVKATVERRHSPVKRAQSAVPIADAIADH